MLLLIVPESGQFEEDRHEVMFVRIEGFSQRGASELKFVALRALMRV